MSGCKVAWRVVNHLSFVDPMWLSIAEVFFLYEEGGEGVSPPGHLKKNAKKKKKLCYFKADVWST